MGITLAARLLSGGGNFLTNYPPIFYPLRMVFRIPVTTNQFVFEFIPVPEPDAPFPYGVPVELP